MDDLYSSAAQVNTPESLVPDEAAMEAEIRLVSRFCTLSLCRAVLCSFMFLFELLRVIYGFRMSSPLYILLFAGVAVWLVELTVTPYVKKSVPVLPYLRRKYHYSSPRYVSHNLCYPLYCLLLLLWQLHNSLPQYPFGWMYYGPAIFLGILLCLRLAGPALIAAHIRRSLLGRARNFL